ncbi:MAG: class I SAM-dependent methyltransferase, partial [Actinomycetota bacterium]|nr:class I SAM-dependent methyltransferase [Actinomycetota bacterium]
LQEWGPPGALVDLGAGNGWAAARLAERGWRTLAIDVNTDPHDGLGAVARHGVSVESARAELGALPLQDESVDVALVNAALHYAPDVQRWLTEALRVVRPGGRVLVVDSPVYSSEAAGAQMVAEQEDRLRSLGTVVPPTPGRGFLLAEEVHDWPRLIGGSWDDLAPNSGLVRRALGRFRAGREVARFSFILGRKDLA